MPFALRGVFVSISKHLIRSFFARFFALVWYFTIFCVVGRRFIKIHLPKMLLRCFALAHFRRHQAFLTPKMHQIEHWTFTICYYITLLLMLYMLVAHFQCTIIPLLWNPNNREPEARASREKWHRCRCRCLLGLL